MVTNDAFDLVNVHKVDTNRVAMLENAKREALVVEVRAFEKKEFQALNSALYFLQAAPTSKGCTYQPSKASR